MNNSIFREMSSSFQLIFFGFFSFVGLFLGASLSLLIGRLIGVDVTASFETQSLVYIRISQVIQTLFWLLIPSLIYAYLFQKNPVSFLKINKIRPIGYIALVVLLVFAIQPLVEFTSFLNQQITFPESLANVEIQFREWENTASRLVERFIADKTILGVISNVFIIAILAAFVEEIFFRGCLQQIIGKIVLNRHAAVWITAIIFSAVHFEFYGFFPRILLGAMLGYLFIWSGSLWISIIAHLANNLGSIIIQQIYYGTPEYQELGSYNLSENYIYMILSLIFSGVIVYVLLKKNRYMHVG